MAASSSSSGVSSQIKALNRMIKGAKRDAKHARSTVRDTKRGLEGKLRTLLETYYPHEEQEEVERLILATDNHLLHVYEAQVWVDSSTNWLSNITLGNPQQEVIALNLSEVEKSTGSARTAVEGMKMERRKGKELEVCPICVEELRLVRVTPCSHSFHSVCLFKWLSSSVGSNSGSCPICRSYLLPISHSDNDQ